MALKPLCNSLSAARNHNTQCKILICFDFIEHNESFYTYSLLCFSIYIFIFNKSCINKVTRKATTDVLTHVLVHPSVFTRRSQIRVTQ